MKNNFIQAFTISIFRLAKNSGNEVLADTDYALQKLVKLSEDSDDLITFFNHPGIPLHQKYQLIDKIEKNQIVKRIVKVIIRLKKIETLKDISKIFSLLVKIENYYLDAKMILPWPSTTAEEKSLKKAVEDYTGRKINLIVKTDPELIGGVYLKINNLILDYSIRKDLKDLKARLIKQ